jgi:hypothetical protein
MRPTPVTVMLEILAPAMRVRLSVQRLVGVTEPVAELVLSISVLARLRSLPPARRRRRHAPLVRRHLRPGLVATSKWSSVGGIPIQTAFPCLLRFRMSSRCPSVRRPNPTLSSHTACCACANGKLSLVSVWPLLTVLGGTASMAPLRSPSSRTVSGAVRTRVVVAASRPLSVVFGYVRPCPFTA